MKFQQKPNHRWFLEFNIQTCEAQKESACRNESLTRWKIVMKISAIHLAKYTAKNLNPVSTSLSIVQRIMTLSKSVHEEEISFYVSRNKRTKERKEYSPKALQLVAPRNCSLAILEMSLDTYNRRRPRKRTINKNRMFQIQSIEYYKLFIF